MAIIRIRRGTTAQWNASTRILQTGELGLDTTLNKIKAGNGVNVWTSLPYLTSGGADDAALITEIAQDAVANAFASGTQSNIIVTYNDQENSLSLATGPEIVTVSSLENRLGDPVTGFVRISDVGNQDGVASLGPDVKIPDIEIPDGIARVTYVNESIANLVNSAPSALNTLNELATALGNDANFSTTITNSIALKAPIASPTFTGTVSGITKSMVGLTNVDNTSDASKPISTATQTALDLKLSTADPAVDYYVINSGSGAYLVNGVSNGTIYFERGKKYRIHVNATGHPFWIQTVSGAYSSGNVYSTGITNNGTQSGHIIVELASNAPQLYYACQFHSSMAGSIVTGTTFATYKALADLSNVNNTSDANKPVSTATQTALGLKANLASPTFTGTPEAPTATAGTNTTQVATTAFVKTAVDNVISNAPGALDTLNELSAALGDDANYAATMTSALALKAPIASPTFTGTVVLPSTTSIGSVSAAAIGYVYGVTSGIQGQLDAKLASATAASTYAPIASPTFTGTVSGITSTMVGLGNVDNTSDTNKPVSTATQLELNLKAPLASPTFTGTVSGISKSMVGLGNVDNTSDSSKPISTATQTALDLKANIASPTFTGTVSGITATMVGLGNVNNTSDANKPVSTATQSALDFKLDTADPAVDYYVTNSGSGAYLVNGVSNGTIYFERGKKYRIHVNAYGHPFWIQTVSGGYSSANVYTTGITGSGTQSGHIIVELPQNAPQLYYACQYHSSMAGSIVTGTSVGSQLETKATFVSPINIVAGTTYTLVANDHKETVLCTSAAAVTVTIPPQSSVPWPAGSIVTIIQSGTGQVTVAAGSGVTLQTQGNSNARKTRYQHQIASLYRTSENTWMITGDLVIP